MYLCKVEKLMHYVWRFRLWPSGALTTTDGSRVDVYDPGELNNGSGPDFFNARIGIGGQMWAGNVEMHIRASDWYRHGHHTDRAYDGVVLHVVHTDDGEVHARTDGHRVPQVVMPGIENFSRNLDALLNNPCLDLPCAPRLSTMPQLAITDWVTTLAMERLQQKADAVRTLLDTFCGDWRRAAFVTLARGLGFGTNADAMEQLARAVPLDAIMRHSDSIVMLEATLLGMAGMLDEQHPKDEYEQMLVNEFAFYRLKFSLPGGTTPLWRSRLRPHNAPARRIAMLAAMLADGFPFVGQALNLTECDSNPGALFDAHTSAYWDSHISPGVPAAGLRPGLSQASRDLLVINVLAPLLYAYGEALDDDRRRELAVDILHNVKAERNSITDIFVRGGLKCRDAFTSQAFIQLRKSYCTPRRCLYCRFGHRLLAENARKPDTAPPPQA